MARRIEVAFPSPAMDNYKHWKTHCLAPVRLADQRFFACQTPLGGQQKAVFGPFLASICFRLALKLRASTTYKSFVCTKTLSSFRQKTSFSHCFASFPLPGSLIIALRPRL
jgi:hypothetical protein